MLQPMSKKKLLILPYSNNEILLNHFRNRNLPLTYFMLQEISTVEKKILIFRFVVKFAPKLPQLCITRFSNIFDEDKNPTC